MITKYRKYRNLFGTMILLILIAVIVAAILSLKRYTAANGSELREISVVVIDPGHGGVDPGAVGVESIKEKDINLAISFALRDMLEASGYEVIMTRDSDVSINDQDCKSISSIKSSDLKNRLKIIDENEGAIAVCIHQNKYPNSKPNGAQMFYGIKNDRSKLLAKSIQDAFVQNLQPNNKRQIKPSTSSVYIVHNAQNPIVLVECGFLSNYDDAMNLKDEEYQRKVAFSIFAGIANASSFNEQQIVE